MAHRISTVLAFRHLHPGSSILGSSMLTLSTQDPLFWASHPMWSRALPPSILHCRSFILGSFILGHGGKSSRVARGNARVEGGLGEEKVCVGRSWLEMAQHGKSLEPVVVSPIFSQMYPTLSLVPRWNSCDSHPGLSKMSPPSTNKSG